MFFDNLVDTDRYRNFDENECIDSLELANGIMEINEGWYNISMKMAKAEHYCIIKEDMSLLAEAEKKWYEHVIEFLKKLLQHVINFFNGIVAWVKSFFVKAKEIVVDYKKEWDDLDSKQRSTAKHECSLTPWNNMIDGFNTLKGLQPLTPGKTVNEYETAKRGLDTQFISITKVIEKIKAVKITLKASNFEQKYGEFMNVEDHVKEFQSYEAELKARLEAAIAAANRHKSENAYQKVDPDGRPTTATAKVGMTTNVDNAESFIDYVKVFVGRKVSLLGTLTGKVKEHSSNLRSALAGLLSSGKSAAGKKSEGFEFGYGDNILDMF